MISWKSFTWCMKCRYYLIGPWFAILLLTSCSRLTPTPSTTVPTLTKIPINTQLAEIKIPTQTAILVATDNPLDSRLPTATFKQTQCAPSRAQVAEPYTIETPLPTQIFSAVQPTRQYAPTPTAGEAMTLRQVTPQTIGTPSRSSEAIISEANYNDLANVAIWGKGSIQTVAYTPDGTSFIVGSPFGIAIYKSDNIGSSPQWVPFAPEYDYDEMYFSQDGKYLLLVKYYRSYPNEAIFNQVRDFSNGNIIDINPDNLEWVKPTTFVNYKDPEIFSLDLSLRLHSDITYGDKFLSDEISHQLIYENERNIVISEVQYEQTYVYYEDYASPEGCDLASFSYCGNVYDPTSLLPYLAGFSPTNDTLAIVYRTNWLGSRFSFLRVYNVHDGSLITQIGGFSEPVQAFAYSPDGQSLLVGFVNGSIQVWSIPQKREVFSAWHFNAPVEYLSFSYDGKYILIQRMGKLEVRFSSDGKLNGRYVSSGFASSPVDNLVAIADNQGDISLNDMASGRTLVRIKAHDGPIYALAFSPDGQMLVSSGEDCGIHAWEVSTGIALHSFEQTRVRPYEDYPVNSRIFIYYLRFVTGTEDLIGFGSWGTAVGWYTNSGARKYVVESAALESYQGMITLNPHFPEFFSVDQANNLFYINENGYNIQDGKFIKGYQVPESLPYGCSLAGPRTKDGKLIFTVGIDNLEGRICILDGKDYHLLGSIQVIGYQPGSDLFIDWIYLSPDGRQLIATISSGVIFTYEIVD